MGPRIRLLRLTPAEAEIAFDAGPAVEVRGRLTGPTCAYSTTVEVAYPVRGNRVVIPEPAWWDTDSPFLYGGTVELWRDGDRVGDWRLRLGLSHAHSDGTVLVFNGRPTELRIERPTSVDEPILRALRAAGMNAVAVSAADAERACEIADRIG